MHNLPQSGILIDGNRLHLNHGPIDLIIEAFGDHEVVRSAYENCLLYTSPSPRDRQKSRMPSSA